MAIRVVTFSVNWNYVSGWSKGVSVYSPNWQDSPYYKLFSFLGISRNHLIWFATCNNIHVVTSRDIWAIGVETFSVNWN